MNDTYFRILAALIFVINASISIYHRRKAEIAGGEKISLKKEGLLTMILLRGFGLALWGMILVSFLQPAWIAWSRIDLPDWARWAGAVMGGISNVLAYWVFSTLGINVTPTVVTRKAHTLVTNGPYRWIRHPLYVMGLIAFLAFALLAENWMIAALTVLAFLVLTIRLRKEEAGLLERFGNEYRQYMQRTGRFLPKLNRS